MPSILVHSLSLRRMIRRWRIVSARQVEGAIGEFVSWIQSTVRLDRDWADDDRLWFGYTADHTSAPPNIPAVAIFSGFRECHIHRIECRMSGLGGGTLFNTECNILKPPAAYNPVLNNAGEFFPFMQTGRNNQTLQLPSARVVGGEQTALMSVTIGETAVNPAIGPRFITEFTVVGPSAFPHTLSLLDQNDPPIILPPNNVLAVQVINPDPGNNQTIFVNFWISERETA